MTQTALHTCMTLEQYTIHVHVDCLSGLGGWEPFPFYFHCLLAGVLCTCTSILGVYLEEVGHGHNVT